MRRAGIATLTIAALTFTATAQAQVQILHPTQTVMTGWTAFPAGTNAATDMSSETTGVEAVYPNESFSFGSSYTIPPGSRVVSATIHALVSVGTAEMGIWTFGSSGGPQQGETGMVPVKGTGWISSTMPFETFTIHRNGVNESYEGWCQAKSGENGLYDWGWEGCRTRQEQLNSMMLWLKATKGTRVEEVSVQLKVEE